MTTTYAPIKVTDDEGVTREFQIESHIASNPVKGDVFFGQFTDVEDDEAPGVYIRNGRIVL